MIESAAMDDPVTMQTSFKAVDECSNISINITLINVTSSLNLFFKRV
jgi:hypothetical protein